MSADLILNLINEVLDNPKYKIIKEQDENNRTVIKFPKFKINEKHWGKNLNTEDRAIIEKIGSQLRGTDPLTRVSFLQDFLTNTETVKKDINVGEVMASLMFLDIFASVVYEFNAAVAGFLFEALFAGIFEGFQIDATEGGGEAGTTDVVLNVKPKGGSSKSGVEYSFKLLTEGGALIKGSFTDIVDGLSKSPGTSETYLVVLKSGTESKMILKFYEFKISQDTWFEWIGAGKSKEVPNFVSSEFVFGSAEVPELVSSNLIGKPIVGKLIDGKFVPKQPSGYSKLDRNERSEIDKKYEDLAGDEIEVIQPKSGLLKAPYSLSDKSGNSVNYLIDGEAYKINIPSGTKRVVEPSANFNELYKAFLKPGGFIGPSGEDFETYVSTGAYKTDPEFFEHLKKLPTYGGGKGAGQFAITQKYMMGHPDVDGPEILELDRQKFQQAAEEYSSLVGEQIYEIFTKLSELINDISGYFLGVSAEERNRFADDSKKKSKELAIAAEENLVKVPEYAPSSPRQPWRRREKQIGTLSDIQESKQFDDQLKLLMKEVFGR